MKIVFVIASNSSGGAERVIVTLANYLANNRQKIYLINFDEDSSFYEVSGNVEWIKLRRKYPMIKGYKTLIGKEKRIINALEKELVLIKPDVVIPFLFNSEFPTITVCRKLNIKCITSIRNSPKVYPVYQRLYRKIMYPKLAGSVFQSEVVQNFKDFNSVKNSAVIMNPLSYKIITHRDYVDRNKIISVGRLNEQKNHILTITAFQMITKQYPEAKLFIYGTGEQEKYLKSEISKRKLNNKVFLMGAVENAVLKNCDAQLFVMASNYEGFPNSLVEAMACHIPVICSNFDTGIAKSLIGEYEERGQLFEIGNSDMLSKKISFSLAHPNEIEKRADLAIEECRKYSVENIAMQWLDFINKCV